MAMLALLGSVAYAQQVGTSTAETHPSLTSQTCDKSGCKTKNTAVVLDSNWRWLHKVGDYTNCYTGNEWDKSLCPDGPSCAKNCAIEGGDYPGTYGITASGNALTLKFVTKGPYSTNIGSRTYLLAEGGGDKYEMFKLKNQEFTFDVDVSNLPCGLNGALYFVEMAADGGMSQFSSNKAGAKYGTGYCDAQCPHDMKFINGEGNVEGWKPNPKDKNAGNGMYGTCCSEMDIWEANKMASAVTPHVCTVRGQTRCSGTQCGDGDKGERYMGVCDKDGCDFNSWRMGNHTFFGTGSQFTIDTTKPFTVITQFITSDNTDNGDLVAIRRKYKQNGRVIDQSAVMVPGMSADSDTTDKFCTAQKQTFNDQNDFAKKGGLKAMGDVFSRGVVLVMSLWDDHDVNMLWLDSDFPTTESPTKPGISRGPCSTDSGKPDDVESKYPDSSVKYSNIKVGTIGSTF